MQEEESIKSRNKLSQQLKNRIKKKVYQEEILSTMYTYSLLEKKNQKGLLSNERLLILIGFQTIGYARNIPEKTLLPFLTKDNIPDRKKQYSLDLIDTVTLSGENFTVSFKAESKQSNWEFHCINDKESKSWKQLIDSAKNAKELQQKNPTIQVVLPNIVDPPSEVLQKQVIDPHKEQLNKDSELIKVRESQPKTPNNEILLKENGEKIEKQEEPIKKQANKPTSTFFVGSTAVENQKIQSQLKSKIEQFQDINSKIKDQYSRKKKQEQNIQELVDSEQNIVGSVINVLKNEKFQLETLKTEWNYEFAKGINEYEVVERFKIYIEILTKRIIDDLGLEPKKRQYKPFEENTKTIKYLIEGVHIEFYINELHEVSTFQDRGTVISNSRIKEAQQILKNSNYILQLTRNRGRIRVPLMMITEYKGFTGLAKAEIPTTENYQNIQSLQRELESLEGESRIDNSIFEDVENVRIVPIESKLYQKMSRSENSMKRFDLCYLEEFKNYLPQDFFNITKQKNYNKLRSQFIQDEEYENIVFSGENMSNVVSRLKLPQKTRDAINVLTEVCKTIPQRVNSLVLQLEGLDQYFTNSQELSQLMHSAGLNVRYLGLLLNRLKQNWLKSIVASEIIARCCKNILKFDLQDTTLNLNESNLENVNNFHSKQIINFLNLLLGSPGNQQGQSFWKQINKQSLAYFKCNISKENLNIGYFLQSLQKNCRIKLQNLDLNAPYFKANNIFHADHFAGFQAHSKIYDLNFTDLYTLIHAKLKVLTYESYEQVRNLLNLSRRDTIPQHFQANGTYDKILLFMINWLPPNEGLNIYYPDNGGHTQTLPSKAFYEIKLTEIKWFLKNKQETQAEEIKDIIIEHINKWLGENHPILTDLYDIFARYYMKLKDQEKKAVNYCKSSIKNQEKLLGVDHIKLADGYYNLGTTYFNFNRKVQALNSLKRARQILNSNQSEDTEAYGQICYRMGQLYLASNSIEQAVEAGKQSLACSQEYENMILYLESAELISRCFQVNDQWEECLQFSDQLSSKISLYLKVPQEMERLIKVIVLPFFHEIAIKSRDISQHMLKIIEDLPASTNTYSAALEYIKQKVQDKSFPRDMLDALSDIETILDEVENNGIVNRWKGFQNASFKISMTKLGKLKSKGYEFISTLEALNVFLSGNFIEGIFLEQM